MMRCMGCMGEYVEHIEVCPHCGYTRGTAPREAYHLPPESILGGRYIVGRVLGFGGFGVTYIGWDAQLERIVAIKEFLPTTFATRLPGGTAVTVYQGGGSQQFSFGLHRFVEEAQLLAQFNGIRGITDIYDTFSGNNTAYIVMEYLKGRDVKAALNNDGPLPYEKARDIVLRVCETLAPVHQKGIIHRDISPDNIYLTDDGEVKLLDFGAARYESSVNSKSLSVILKSGYAPEEQYRSKGEQGPWTDVYALAATFYKMLTGATPPDSMERAVRDEIKEPSKCGAQLPKSVENAIMNALNLRKADRTKGVAEFKAALQTDGVERVKVKPGRKKSGRLPVPAIVGMAIAGALLVAFFALDATGVVDMSSGETATSLVQNSGGEITAPDNFGEGVPEGKVVVPNVINLDENEARLALEAVGLVLEIGKGYISPKTPIGNVTAQDPQPGRQAAVGSTVTIQRSGGTLTQAMDSGAIPSFVGMSAAEGGAYTDAMIEYGMSWLYPYFAYEYSQGVPAGTIIRFTHENDETRCVLYVSAGQDNTASAQGEARAPFMIAKDSDVQFYAALMPEVGAEDYSRAAFEYSTDGTEWSRFTGAYEYTTRNDEFIKPVGKQVWAMHSSASSGMMEHYDDILGKRLQFRFSPSQNKGKGVLLEQTMLVQAAGEAVQVDSCERLTTEEIMDLTMEGYSMNNDLYYWLESDVQDGDLDDHYVYRLKGSFDRNEQFAYFVEGRLHDRWPRVAVPGEILLVFTPQDMRNLASCGWDGGSEEVVLYPVPTYEISPDGAEVTALMRPPTTLTLPFNLP